MSRVEIQEDVAIIIGRCRHFAKCCRHGPQVMFLLRSVVEGGFQQKSAMAHSPFVVPERPTDITN